MSSTAPTLLRNPSSAADSTIALSFSDEDVPDQENPTCTRANLSVSQVDASGLQVRGIGSGRLHKQHHH